MRGKIARGLILTVALSPVALADEPALALADLEAYRLALAKPVEPDAPTVRFRDLWEHPEAWTGRTVRVEGKLARRFRQGPVGEFPALVEAWIVDPSGDPICLVSPDDPARSPVAIGDPVRFGGTFLRKIRYQGGDNPRLAPLVVGPSGPGGPKDATPGPDSSAWPGSGIDWAVGLGGSALILLILIRRHLDRPITAAAVLDPDPRFVDDPDGPPIEGDGS